ncbi:hypothetical protein SIID45300_03030 [Candidatus Magnetaquicoccaceae bacterium FCR-1]|uniref:Lipoprotein n=1 Tax=Candidatus Magnetaquiglobus chichijimensis TaxID=3141448 RepID=A0ABQ0CCQ2_9PROT
MQDRRLIGLVAIAALMGGCASAKTFSEPEEIPMLLKNRTDCGRLGLERPSWIARELDGKDATREKKEAFLTAMDRITCQQEAYMDKRLSRTRVEQFGNYGIFALGLATGGAVAYGATTDLIVGLGLGAGAAYSGSNLLRPAEFNDLYSEGEKAMNGLREAGTPVLNRLGSMLPDQVLQAGTALDDARLCVAAELNQKISGLIPTPAQTKDAVKTSATVAQELRTTFAAVRAVAPKSGDGEAGKGTPTSTPTPAPAPTATQTAITTDTTQILTDFLGSMRAVCHPDLLEVVTVKPIKLERDAITLEAGNSGRIKISNTKGVNGVQWLGVLPTDEIGWELPTPDTLLIKAPKKITATENKTYSLMVTGSNNTSAMLNVTLKGSPKTTPK